ncbi:MAG: PEGA domain-containing protein [Deltaproteobacteria bacterium]|nr:PEGA domain-containing protein [Deltaproteobacteria bacterium]MCB9788770.1 PEGA domain-containing protein [Deltaproteobacteria bacterium]
MKPAPPPNPTNIHRLSPPARAALALLVLAGSWGAAAPAMATVEDEAAAHELYQQAADDFEARDYEAAAEKLTRAYALFPKPIILIKKGEALEQLGRVEEAYELVRDVVPDDKRMEPKLRALVARLERVLERPIKVSVLSGSLTGARIILDGQDTGQVTPTVLDVPRGNHDLRLEKLGYRPYERAIDAKGVDLIVVEGQLVRLMGRVRVRLGTGNFTDTVAYLDGNRLQPVFSTDQATPLVDVPIGAHTLECRREREPVERVEIVLEADATVDHLCLASGPSASRGRRALAWTLLGAGAAGLAGGAVLLVSYQSDLDHGKETNQRVESNKQIFGPVALGLGVAAVTTGIILLAKRPAGPSTEAHPVVVGGYAAPGGAGLVASGRF